MERDPKVVLQAHALRVAAARAALLHGRRAPRTSHTGLGGLWASLIVGAVTIMVVIVTSRVITLLQHAGH